MKLVILLFVVHQVFAKPTELDGEAFAAGLNTFSDKLMQKFEFKEKNLIYSPVGLAMVLGMVLKGAKGKTYDDIYKMLNMGDRTNKDNIHKHFKMLLDDYRKMDSRSVDQRNVSLELTNAAFWQEGLTLPKEYTDQVKAIYEAIMSQENFATNGGAIKDKINKLVKERTHDLIPQLYKEPLPADTVFILMNIIYFKGFWKIPFAKQDTHKKVFYNGDKTEKETDFMTITSYNKYYHCNVHKASILELPYKGDFSMFVMLPDEKYGLSKMIEEWPLNKLSDFIVEMNKPNGTKRVDVYLPKFDINYTTKSLLDIMTSLGANVRPALTPLNQALVITDAFQTAKIKVYEAGTEAVAVTVFSGTRIGLPEPVDPPIEFKADHPFSYCIRDTRRGINMFCGTVMHFK